jgi:hypothetical protein
MEVHVSESGTQDETEEIDDPGRDPKGLDPPRNLFGGGPDQDSGRGEPKETPDSQDDSGDTTTESPPAEDDGS